LGMIKGRPEAAKRKRGKPGRKSGDETEKPEIGKTGKAGHAVPPVQVMNVLEGKGELGLQQTTSARGLRIPTPA